MLVMSNCDLLCLQAFGTSLRACPSITRIKLRNWIFLQERPITHTAVKIAIFGPKMQPNLTKIFEFQMPNNFKISNIGQNLSNFWH